MPKRQVIADICLLHRLPCLTSLPIAETTGFLLAFGSPLAEYREKMLRAYDKIDRILRGEKPFEIPVALPKRIEVALNLKTARAIGVTVPQALLQRADRLIE